MTGTELAFSRPWSEAIDLRVPPMKMSVFASFVEADGHHARAGAPTPILTDATLCSVDPRSCRLGACTVYCLSNLRSIAGGWF